MIMNKLRNQYIYQLIGQIQSQQLKKVPANPQPFYQLNILCENNPSITKIYVFKPKTTPQIWQTIEKNSCLGKKYLFYCQNCRGYYRVIDWKLLSEPKNTELNEICQYQAPNCQQVATYQHTLKLGSVSLGKQWVCGNCKQELENSHEK